MRHPLAGECLELLNRVARRVGEKGADEMEAFIV